MTRHAPALAATGSNLAIGTALVAVAEVVHHTPVRWHTVSPLQDGGPMFGPATRGRRMAKTRGAPDDSPYTLRVRLQRASA